MIVRGGKIDAMKKLICLMVGFLAGSASAQPSFDCDKATLGVEKMICADPMLSSHDRWLDRDYRTILENTEGEVRVKVITEQKAWLAQRNEQPCDSACLAGRYAKRNGGLVEWYDREVVKRDPCRVLQRANITDKACAHQEAERSRDLLDRAFERYLDVNEPHFANQTRHLGEGASAEQIKRHLDARRSEFEHWKRWRDAYCEISRTNAMGGSGAPIFFHGCIISRNEQRIEFFERFEPVTGNKHWQ